MSNSYVLVINSGSSSLKFAVIDSKSGDALVSGLGECFGLPEAVISWKYQGQKTEEAIPAGGNHHKYAVNRVVALLETLGLSSKFVAVGHRIVAGGETFKETVRVNESVIADVETLAELAPLHNKANAAGMRAAMEAFPNLPQFAVFDTAFHQTMPEKAFVYALPYELYQEHKVRRYGAHGTSHYYVSREAAKAINKPVEESNFITVHLGNGASVSAIKNGQCIDTSMGLTPLAGLMMGTRCGDLDPSVIEFLFRKGWKQEELFEMLNKKSGFLGVSGITSDARGVLEAMDNGNPRAKLAFDIFTYRVAKYIGSYMVAIGEEVDAIVFTGGIGENSLPIRSEILKYLKVFGYQEDEAGNAAARFGQSGTVTTAESKLAMVIPTNEEFVIAQQSVAML
ncbi:acetate/propionate family kinase [Vibrio fluvialis]|uniref:acetate/propionate family kinase n=1 Tax=Vibrio fluvialis TaxID=676 RepID=UPI001559EE7D|nr:acetate/propionate family kinase [Vibrio fluvialis]EKO3417839.1 acetate/propionate family kinase [Vibrio fluvialis]EKO3482385.1 acetate/propionate family kinase [Vibrio fluvialis]EKO3548767.1 acetate/propionate family kinase [Vibrio fluvialis]ELG4656392.1 acetate/propionate family kinase [Vibrio fluvialis]ELK3677039.1 acetate/propionate family kinase [Vibrio fluvialis]